MDQTRRRRSERVPGLSPKLGSIPSQPATDPSKLVRLHPPAPALASPQNDDPSQEQAEHDTYFLIAGREAPVRASPSALMAACSEIGPALGQLSLRSDRPCSRARSP